MPSIPDWIAAISTLCIAVMAFLILNGTWKPTNPWAEPIPSDPTPSEVLARFARLEEAVQTQTDLIKALQERETEFIDLFLDIAEVLEQE